MNLQYLMGQKGSFSKRKSILGVLGVFLKLIISKDSSETQVSKAETFMHFYY